VIAVEEAVGKFRAADRIRKGRDPNFLLIARTDAAGVAGGSLDDAIRRANAYLGAGADVAFIEGPTTVDEIRRIVREVRGPILYNQAGAAPRLTTEQLRDIGVAIVIFPGAMLRSGLYAMHDYAMDLRSRGAGADMDFARRTQGHPLANLHALAGFDRIRALEEEFLPPGETRKYDGSAGFQPPRP